MILQQTFAMGDQQRANTATQHLRPRLERSMSRRTSDCHEQITINGLQGRRPAGYQRSGAGSVDGLTFTPS